MSAVQLRRLDPAQDMARFYLLDVPPAMTKPISSPSLIGGFQVFKSSAVRIACTHG